MGRVIKADSFLQMIEDAKVDALILSLQRRYPAFPVLLWIVSSIRRNCLEHNVGVLFQNDNINTLDPDSEFGW